MANPIPPLVSNTPPPIDFDENNENYEFDGFENADVTFNTNFIEDTPSLPSTPRDLSKTSDSISELDLPVVPPDDTDHIISNESIDKAEIISTNLDNNKIILYEIENICDKLANHNNFNNDNNYYNPELAEACDTFEIETNDDHNTSEQPGHLKCNEDTGDNNVNFENPKLNEDPPSILLSNNGLNEECTKYSSTSVTNDNTQILSTDFDVDGSVLSLNLDTVRSSPDNSPILNQKNLKYEEYDDDVETEKLENDNCVIELHKLQEFQEQLNSSTVTFTNEFVNAFETHFEANFQDAQSHFNDHTSVDATSRLSDIDGDDFDDFQDFTTAPTTNVLQSRKFTEDEINDKKDDLSYSANNTASDDDDDFGEFTQSNVIPQLIGFYRPVLQLQQLNSILDHMFPLQKKFDENHEIDIQNYDKIEKDTSLVNLLDFDSTIALNYQWNNSNSNQVLVKSLGIDSRNILFGLKWNISVPRFAANLGFTPLEPLKPTATPAASNSYGINNNVSSIEIQNVTGTDVPAVQFDWSSAGLVNPLDGQTDQVRETFVPENQPTRTEINSITNFLSNMTTTSTVSSSSTVLSPSTLNPASVASEVISPSEAANQSLKTDLEVQLEYNSDFGGVVNSYVPSSTGNLRETHIFTPSKSINPISRDVSNINVTSVETTNIDKDLEEFQLSSEIKINKNVITKEYRDVEYEFSEANDILQPIKMNINNSCNSNTNVIINWPEPGDISSSLSLESEITSKSNSDEFEFTEFQGTNTIKYDPQDDDIDYDAELSKAHFKNSNNSTKCPILSSPVQNPIITNIDEFLKPTIGLSPTQELKTNSANIDLNDEFTEFQYVAAPPLCSNTKEESTMISNTIPVTQQINKRILPNYNNLYEQSSNTLAPPNLHNTKVNILNENYKPSINSVWADPYGSDSDEFARIEAAFSYNKSKSDVITSQNIPESIELQDGNKSLVQTNNKDDDEWSDFVSSSTVATIKADNTINTTNLSCNNTAVTSADDDWSDFVSGVPAVPIISNNFKSVYNHRDNSRPNFSSWNSPIQYNSYKVPQLPHDTEKFYKIHKHGLILNPMVNHNQLSNGISLLDIDQLNNQHLQSNQSNLNNNNNIGNSSTNNNHNNSKLQQQRQQQPNISLIPDLGFIAPKKLINGPRTNVSTKK